MGETGGAEEMVGWPVAGGKDGIGRGGGVAHGKGDVVARDGGAGQLFQDTELDFMGLEGEEAVEAGGEAGGGFGGEAGDEVGVDEGMGIGAQEAEVVGGEIEVLGAADGIEDGGVERLDADFELEGARGEAREDGAKFGGEAVGEHFEVEEKAGEGGDAVEEKREDFDGAGDVEVEGAVAELELAGAAGEEAVECGEERGEGEEADGRIDGGDAIVAAHGAAAGRFDVEGAVGEVGVGIFVVGELDEGKVGERRGNGPGEVRARAGRRREKDVAAEGGEGEVPFAEEEEVGVGRGGAGDFGAAEDDEQIGEARAEQGEKSGDEGGVPDVDAEAEDAGIKGGDGLGDFGGGLLDGEFGEGGLGAEDAHIGEEAAGAEGGVAVARVDGGEEDGRMGWHGGIEP